MYEINDLRDSKEFLASLLDNINSAVFLVDKNVRVKSFNNSFKTLFGKDESAFNQFCGNALGCVFAVKEGKECGTTNHCKQCFLRKNLLKSLVEKAPEYKEILEREFFIDNKYVNKILQYSTKPLEFNNETLTLVIIEDITILEENKRSIEAKNKELKATNEQLHITNVKLKNETDKRVQLEKENAVLSLGVTANHELNQPLSVAMSSLTLLDRSLHEMNIDEKQQKLLHNTDKSLKKMADTIKKYFDKTRKFHFDKYVNDVDMVIFDDDE